MTDIKGLTLGDLFSRLHSAISDFVRTMEETVRADREVDTSEIKTLREHIRERLGKNENVEDNRKMLKVLDLFATNSAVIELVRLDAEDWLKFIDDIEKGMEQKLATGNLTEDELGEIKQMQRLTAEIKAIIRK